MTAVVYNCKSFHIKAILNVVKEKFLRALALNKGKRHELAIFYDYEIIIYDLLQNSANGTFKVNYVKNMEFNNDNLLIVVTLKNEIYVIDINTRNISNICKNGIIARWYPFDNIHFAYANTSNEICFRERDAKKAICSLSLDKGEEIADLVWYDSDENYKYILVGFKSGNVSLCDMGKPPNIITKFDKYGNNLRKLVWLKNEPGSFISIYKATSRIVVWNVSRKSYKKITKFSEYPIVNCLPFSDGKKLLMSLENGEVQIFDLINFKPHFEISPGHSETIFDMKFSPFKYGIFATCAYDGFIKIWDMTKNKVILTLMVNDPGEIMSNDEKYKIYSLKWSPNDKELLLTGDSRGNIRLWDIDKQKQLSCLKLNRLKKGEIIGIDWNTNNSILASLNESVYVCSYEGNKLLLDRTILIKTRAFQIKFSPHDANDFGVGCEDGIVRIYSTTQKDTSEPKAKLKGHTQKVFGISYNPKSNILASSSDDFKIGIWDIKTSKGKFLIGHTNNVRQILWMNELSRLLISGSWDGTTRIWNIDLMICVGLISEHHSDVYGMDISPNHPFLLVTTSRDNSIRFWNYVKNPIEYVLYFDNKSKFDIYKKYPTLLSLLGQCDESDVISKAEQIANFFFYHDNTKELFDILRVVLGKKEHSNEENSLFYIRDLYSAYKSKILNLEFKYFNQSKFDYHIKREELLKEAIDYSAKCGDWEKFCELNIELGNWKKAIMAAPHVSMSYWEELTKRYADYKEKSDQNGNDISTIEERLNVSLLSNEYEPATRILCECNEYEDAKVVWYTRTVMRNNNKKIKKSFFDDNDIENEDIANELENLKDDSDLSKITFAIAKSALNSGDSIKAACAFLSIRRIDLCLKTLVRSNELCFAYFIMKITKNYLYEKEIMFGLLCEQIKLKNYDKAISIIRETSNTELKIILYSFFRLNHKMKENDEKDFIGLARENTNINLKLILEKKYDETFSNFAKLREKFINEIKAENVNENTIISIFDFYSLSKIINWEEVPSNIKFTFYHSMLSTIIMLEILNKNAKAIGIHLREIIRIKQNINIEEKEDFIYQMANAYYRFIYNKDIFSNAIKPISKHRFDISKLQSIFEKFNNGKVKKFTCDDQLHKFYYLKSETFPSNTKKVVVSANNSKVIKGKAISVNNFCISQSEGLESEKFAFSFLSINNQNIYNSY